MGGNLHLASRAFLKKIAAFSMMFSLVVTIGNIASAEEMEAQANEEAKTMVLAMQSPTPGRTIPPIDTSAPTRVETATFALG